MTGTLGLLVNPVAGVGGAAGLAGSDGVEVQLRAAELGGVSHAAERAAMALAHLRSLLVGPDTELVVAPGAMGETAAAAAHLPCRTLPVRVGDPTSAGDTAACATAFADLGVDLLLFAGGDGTAADVARGCEDRIPVLGIPSGVKMYSGCFAVSPRAAADIAARILNGKAVASTTVEVVDLDEDALRDGHVRPKLVACLAVPAASTVQSRKAPTAADLAGQVAAVAMAAADLLGDGVPTAVGPGGTTAAVLRRLDLTGTLLGVDVVQAPELLAANVSEAELYGYARRGPLRILLTVIGGQGFLFGRGNQQFSARVIEAVGSEHIVVVAPDGKLAALGGRPLLVDTGDPDTDRSLAGYRRILTGPGQWSVYPVGDRIGRSTGHPAFQAVGGTEGSPE